MKNLTLRNLFVSLHVLFVISLGIIALFQISPNLVLPYITLTLLASLQLGLSSHTLFKEDGSKFLYLFGLLVVLGCWFKYSIYIIFPKIDFPEPIGNFILGSSQETTVLWVSIIGNCGIFCAQLLNAFFAKRLMGSRLKEIILTKRAVLAALIVLLLTTLTALINLKYNILLFALKPDVQLPFKGNVIFFLLMTRGLPFLFLFLCLRKFNLIYISLGALLFTISSVGVLSRMGIFIYFFVIFFLVIRELPKWNIKSALMNICALAVIFAVATYLNVSLSTGAREYFFKQSKAKESFESNNEVSMNAILESSNESNNLKIIKHLALGRWIGVEGIMAVNAYPNKGFKLIFEALSEKSYDGNSFYSTISSKGLVSSNHSKIVATSVPGPIAFFYYSSSYLLIFSAIFIASIFYLSLEHLLFFLFPNLVAPVSFLIIVLTLDFYQFGIAPIAFSKYLGFTIVSSLLFFIFIKRFFPNYIDRQGN